MALITDILEDYYPPNSGVSVPLRNPVTIQFDREMDQSSVAEEFFIEGPDTDTYTGPGFQLLEFPDTISQGDDFLESPSYAGIVDGTFSFTVTNSKTFMSFTPTHPFVAHTLYTAHLPEVLDLAGNTHSGHVIFSWTTGTGSIEYVPETFSSSILVPGSAALATVSLGESASLEVNSITPKDHAIQIDPQLSQIVIEFNKDIDPASITDDVVTVTSVMSSDHPKASGTENGELTKVLEVDGNKLIIKI